MHVFIDIGDTLIDESRYARSIHERLHRLFAARRLDYTIDQFLEHWDLTTNRAGWRSFFELLNDLAKLTGHDTMFAMELFQEFSLNIAPRARDLFQPFPDATSTLQRLRQMRGPDGKPLHLGLLANQPHWIRQRMEEWGLLLFFEPALVIISDEVGVSKPHPEIFQFALYRAGTQPADTVMVGNDFRNDIVPAKALDWHTCWLRRPNPYQGKQSPAPNDTSAADTQLQQLSDIPAALEALGCL
jgi:FMN phosphatase YigB (HAD superfamily)